MKLTIGEDCKDDCDNCLYYIDKDCSLKIGDKP